MGGEGCRWAGGEISVVFVGSFGADGSFGALFAANFPVGAG